MSILRPAIAMIELIFALVIMGIVMMSAPMLISTATNSGYIALQQEGINQAVSRVSMIMGYSWDENDTNDTTLPPILYTTAGAPELNATTTTARRRGTPLESQRTFIFVDSNHTSLFASIPANLGKDANESFEDDVDDFIGETTLTDIQTASIDYVEKTTINIRTNVRYSEDNVTSFDSETLTYFPFNEVTSGSTNVKDIIVTLTSSSGVSELNKTIVLRAFSSNIGGYTLEERSF